MNRLAPLVVLVFLAAVAFQAPAAADLGEVVRSIPHPGLWGHGLTWDGEHLLLWSSDYADNTLYQLDPTDGTVVHSFEAPGRDPQGLAWDGDSLWYADSMWSVPRALIAQLDPSDGTILNAFDAPGSAPMGLTWDGQYLWNVDWYAAMIYKLDPSDGAVVDSFASPASRPYGIAWDGQHLWSSDWGTNLIYKLDAGDGAVLDSFAAPGDYAFDLAFDGRYLWNLDYPSTIYQIDIGAHRDVEIDIRPGSDSNPVNPMSRGLIPVAIISSDTFRVSDVDVTTLAFGPGGAAPTHAAGGHLEDVDGDGLTDLVSHYRIEEAGIAFGDVEACLTGETLDGMSLEGCDSVDTQPVCGSGYQAAFALTPLAWIGGRMGRRRR